MQQSTSDLVQQAVGEDNPYPTALICRFCNCLRQDPPYRRAIRHPLLEKMATDYLAAWRFNPLPEETPQEEQWGLRPIKFRRR